MSLLQDLSKIKCIFVGSDPLSTSSTFESHIRKSCYKNHLKIYPHLALAKETSSKKVYRKMKTFTIGIVVLFFGISCNGFPSEHHDPSEAEFEKEFHVKHNNPEQEAKAAKQLAKEEIEIDYQNDLFDAGTALRRLRLL